MRERKKKKKGGLKRKGEQVKLRNKKRNQGREREAEEEVKRRETLTKLIRGEETKKMRGEKKSVR